ncbi:Uncharacterized protein ToN1_49730 [Aromatoleum petrolei]|nr:Uncharacterized protein ToN1_49730 [Aromatoleum petrolei]
MQDAPEEAGFDRIVSIVGYPDFVIVPKFARLPKSSRGRWAKRSTILATEFLYCTVLPVGQP